MNKECFAKFNIQNWTNLASEKKVNMKFLCELLPYFSDAKNEQLLLMSPYIKRKIGCKLGWQENTVLNRCSVELCKLRDLGIITRTEQQVYQLNPNYIGIGDDEDISNLASTFWLREPREKSVNNIEDEKEDEENEIVIEEVLNESNDTKEMDDVMKALMAKAYENIAEAKRKKRI